MGLVGGIAGYLVRKNIAEGKIATAEETAARIVQEAEKTGEAKKKETLLEAKEEIHRLRSEVERENKERRSELQRLERRLVQKEENLDKKLESYEKKEEHLIVQENKLRSSQEKVDELFDKQTAELERISGLTADDAKKELLTSVETEIKHETAILIKDLEQQAKEEADKMAREIVFIGYTALCS